VSFASMRSSASLCASRMTQPSPFQPEAALLLLHGGPRPPLRARLCCQALPDARVRRQQHQDRRRLSPQTTSPFTRRDKLVSLPVSFPFCSLLLHLVCAAPVVPLSPVRPLPREPGAGSAAATTEMMSSSRVRRGDRALPSHFQRPRSSCYEA
jgi:hypothetical protein